MSFRTSHGSPQQSFDLVRRSLLQAPDLPFADTLSAEQFQRAFEAWGQTLSLVSGEGEKAKNKVRTPPPELVG